MSVLITAGYYAISNQILNIIFKPTTVWRNGIILTNQNKVISTLKPENENNLKLVYYKDSAVLLLNNSIIYQDNKLFNYNLNLSLTDDEFTFNKERFDKCISYYFTSMKLKT
jgi:hypothetical protein